ncbi:MAG: galactokinase family protein, partial [Kutzneria sp.]|nr:galactokinase family protein [Kutzneria sp.]
MFRELHGRAPEGVWSAPGRVNLIGEHTDYNDGFVMPFALPHRAAMAARRREDSTLTVATLGD